MVPLVQQEKEHRLHTYTRASARINNLVRKHVESSEDP